MKLLNQDLLTLLISLFIFTGCQNPDSIGLDVDPDNAIEGKLIDTITVRSSTVRDDSVNTKSLSKYPLGYLKDPFFGTTDSKLAISLTLPSDKLTFGTSPVLDSAVLVLKYADEYTGDLNSKLQVEVFQLVQQLTDNSNYSGNAEHGAETDLLGSKSVKVNIKDSVTIKELVKGAADISKKKAAQIRIPINSAFIKTNFLNGTAANFASNFTFNEFIKGLQIKVNGNLTNGSGGLVLLDLANADSRLEIYYKSQNGTAVDTSLTSFSIATNTSAATIKHDYTGTALKTHLNSPATSYDINYVQPLGGVKTSIRFPYIKNLKSLGNITINKAELIVQIENGSDIFSPTPKLFLYRTDIAEQLQPMPDVLLGLTESSLGGFYDSSKKRYRFTLTAYVQDLLSGKLLQYNTYISAEDLKPGNNGKLMPSVSTVSRAVFGSGNTAAPIKMKLNVVYTKVN